MEYQEERNLQSISNPNTELARGQFALADRLQRFGQFGMERYEDTMVKRAQEQAGKVVPSTDAPDLRSATTVVGRVYNQTVLAGHNAAVRNDIYKHINELVSQHGNDPIMLKEKAMAYKSATLNQVAPEIRWKVSTDFDALFNPALTKITEAKQLAEVAANVGEIRQTMIADRDQSLIALKNGDIEQQLYFESNFREYVKEIAEIDPEAAQEIAAEYQNVLKPLYTYMGDYEEAHTQGFGDSYIDAFENDPPEGISLDTRDEIVSAMRSRRTQLTAAEAEQKSALEQQSALELTKFFVDSSEAMIPVDEMIRKGRSYLEKELISPEKFASLIGQYNRTLEKRKEKAIKASEEAREMQADVSFVESVVRGDASYPVTQKQVDKYYEYASQSFSPEQMEEVTRLTIENTRLVPSMFRDQVKTGIYSKDPAMIASAAETIDWMNTVPGLAKLPFSDHELAYSDVMNAGLDTYGRTEEGVLEAREKAEKLTDPQNKTLIEARKDRIKDQELNQGVVGKVEKMFSGWFGLGKPEIYESIEPTVRREYNETWNNAYLLNGSEEYADKMAESKIKRTYGKFQGTLMKYPPQYYYQAYDGDDGKWIMEEALEDVREGYGDDFGGIILTADHFTDQTAMQGKPQYLIQVVTENGIETLSGDYFIPDIEAERERRRQEVSGIYGEGKQQDNFSSRFDTREIYVDDERGLGVKSNIVRSDESGEQLQNKIDNTISLVNDLERQSGQPVKPLNIIKKLDAAKKEVQRLKDIQSLNLGESRKGQMGRGDN